MLRLRIRYTAWPRPALELTDTPRPDCLDCEGAGGWNEPRTAPNGDFDGMEWIPCICWDPSKSWFLLPIPRRINDALQARRAATVDAPF